MNTDAMISRFMDVHNNKITELLGYEEKQNVLSKYLRMRNKIGLNYLKPEIEGLQAELEEERLKLQNLRKQVVRNKEDVTMTKLQNNEIRRQIGKVEKSTHEVQQKQIKIKFNIDEVYNDIFVKNDTLKLYDKTIGDLKSAVDMEKVYYCEL